MKKVILLLAAIVLFKTVSAQTSAGKCFSMPTNGSAIINCGASNSFNTGSALTLETWVRPNSTDNQKIMGKMSGAINDGYVLGMDGALYPEVWATDGSTITHYGFNNGGTMPADSAWVHIAMTYSAAGNLTAYINGQMVEQLPVPLGSNGLSSNTANFVIGNAPWATSPSLEMFGYLDEVRVWSIERSQSDIQATMFKHLQGTETGLIAYYDFNKASGTSVPDASGQGNTGTLTGTGGTFVNSFAAAGDDSMYKMNSVQAIWYGKNTSGSNLYNYGLTTNGLKIIGDIGVKHFDYAVFGCDTTTSGVSTAYLPVNAPTGFTRLSREWLFQVGGTVNANSMYFDLGAAAGGGTSLVNGSYVAGDYTLMSRTSRTQPYTPIASGASITGNVVTFNNVALNSNAYYTVGASSTNLHLGVNNVAETATPVLVFPNPASSLVTIANVAGAQLNVYDNTGRMVKSVKQDNIIYKMDVSNLANGVYYLQVLKDNDVSEQKIIVQK